MVQEERRSRAGRRRSTARRRSSSDKGGRMAPRATSKGAGAINALYLQGGGAYMVPSSNRRNSTSRARVSIDPKAIRNLEIYGRQARIRQVEKFTPEMVEEVKDLFSRFDKSGDNELDRAEFGPLLRMLGLDLSEGELDNFFGRMDESGDGYIELNELIEFLEQIAQPLTLEEELSEAFFFFGPEEFPLGDDSEESSEEGSEQFSDGEYSDTEEGSEESAVVGLGPPAINAKGLAKALSGMGEEITEDECADMIAEATGGADVITFEQFREFSRPEAGSDAASQMASRNHVKAG